MDTDVIVAWPPAPNPWRRARYTPPGYTAIRRLKALLLQPAPDLTERERKILVAELRDLAGTIETVLSELKG
jgi:hypothetical protein